MTNIGVNELAEIAIARVKAELTDIVFQKIQSDKELMTAYMRAVSSSSCGDVNRQIGLYVKKAFGLENLARESEPTSCLIQSYTQFT